VNGTVILYAETTTRSMKAAMDETARRREKQIAFNEAHGITPQTVARRLYFVEQAEDAAKRVGVAKPSDLKALVADPREAGRLIERLRKEMQEAARRLEFERAAELRDRIRAVKAVMGQS